MNLEIALYRLAGVIHPNDKGGTLFYRIGTLRSVTRHFKRGSLESTSLHFDDDMEPKLGIHIFSTPLDIPLELIGKKIHAEEFYHTHLGPLYYKGYVVNEVEDNPNGSQIAIVQHQWEFGKYFDDYNNSYDLLYRQYKEENERKEKEDKR